MVKCYTPTSLFCLDRGDNQIYLEAGSYSSKEEKEGETGIYIYICIYMCIYIIIYIYICVCVCREREKQTDGQTGAQAVLSAPG